ncbi:hypothetical protein A2960_01790 [Candidatus Gottesmanbacteria bacterium RIFCSPLOWO2_01_FULL_39_12b]|uniref:DNA polymerase III subunit delta n=1 Tax=Candidatus Gottesmanbacteria bacterium RIFCSPLOWO2_01_FULL_39_12b TaxID=1798388 RepID=A0A1F6AQW3_9BACT|nr:MAG: hypothetical protein A2960_01790 [Candidatus Gottesmanbacteria bacterium RIFCSPLOWO2_01_FULL_39_12b]
MITIIHGDDAVLSRNTLKNEISEYSEAEIVSLDGNRISITELMQACESLSLFSSAKLIRIENLLSGGLKQKAEMINYLTKVKCEYPVYLWEKQEIEKTITKKFPSKTKIILCQPPKLLFNFLESIGFFKGAQLVNHFHLLLEQSEVELILVMIYRQFRNLILVKAAKKSNETVTGLPSWQQQKLLKQASQFTLEKLIVLYRKLISLEYKIKSGQTPFNLRQLLDIYFLSL